ncbi:hypothetical protein HDU87_007347 [Geranomyces variabilis]|uniref:Sm domain-containing protein n=1 Tax=Geranomyces variabilis TaxID=109894 RepID=A0AAD5TF66_9FUNG|nr:hypothetical protein HDU87_007347 [Geranomyces variabilis]
MSTLNEVQFFREMPQKHAVAVNIQHWQLRHQIQCPTRNDECVYATQHSVDSYNTETKRTTSLLAELAFKPVTIAASFEYIAAAGQRGQVVACELGSDESPVQIAAGRNCTNGLCVFDHHGQPRLLSCSNDKTIKVYSLPKLDLLHTIGFPEPVNYAAVSPDGRKMVAVGDGEDAYLYDISAGGEFTRTATLEAGRDAGFSCAWDRTSQRFAVATQDNHVRVWDVRDLAQPVAEIITTNELRTAANAPRSVKFSLTGPDLLLFSEHMRKFHVVDARTFNDRQVIQVSDPAAMVHICGVCLSPDAKTIFAATKVWIPRSNDSGEDDREKDEVTVELKNDLEIRGTLVSVDQFLNIKLDDIGIVNETKYPHMMSVKNCFIRGSVVRYVSLPAQSVDTALLQDAARREAQAGR